MTAAAVSIPVEESAPQSGGPELQSNRTAAVSWLLASQA
jgi:hypothetical protein